jgi:hypothetical protein
MYLTNTVTVEWYGDRRMTFGKGFGRKLLCPNQVISDHLLGGTEENIRKHQSR